MTAIAERPANETTATARQRTTFRRGHDKAKALLSLVWQVTLVAGLVMLYRLGRRFAEGRVDEAFSNGHLLWQWERRWHLPNELSLVEWTLNHPVIAQAANLYYANVHFPLTAGVLLWLYLRRRASYWWARNVLILMTGAALIMTFTVPMAPPRMLTMLGFTDVAAVFGQSVYDGPADTASNQYAAMPSLHVGWAVLVAIALIRASKSRYRWCWLAHPAITVFVVLCTANHYIVDGVVGAALCGLAIATIALFHRIASRSKTRRRTTESLPSNSESTGSLQATAAACYRDSVVSAPPVRQRRGGDDSHAEHGSGGAATPTAAHRLAVGQTVGREHPLRRARVQRHPYARHCRTALSRSSTRREPSTSATGPSNPSVIEGR